MVSVLASRSSGLCSNPAGDIVLCSQARHFTLTVPVSTQMYKWVPANLMLGIALWWTSIPSRGSRNTLNHFMLQKLYMEKAHVGTELLNSKRNTNAIWKVINNCMPVKSRKIPLTTKNQSALTNKFKKYFISVVSKTARKACDLAIEHNFWYLIKNVDSGTCTWSVFRSFPVSHSAR